MRTVIGVSSYEAASKKRVGAQVAPRCALAKGTMVKIDARAAQAIHVLHESFTGHVNDVGEKLVGHHGLAILSAHSFVTNARWFVDETCRSGSCAGIVAIGEHGERFGASLDQHRNRGVTQSQHIQRLLFCMLRYHRRHLIEACIFSRTWLYGIFAHSQRASIFAVVSPVALGNKARFTQQL